MIPIPELENIDAQAPNTSFFGHDYFVSATPLLADIELLLNFDRRPDDRPPLQVRMKVNYKGWKFP